MEFCKLVCLTIIVAAPALLGARPARAGETISVTTEADLDRAFKAAMAVLKIPR